MPVDHIERFEQLGITQRTERDPKQSVRCTVGRSQRGEGVQVEAVGLLRVFTIPLRDGRYVILNAHCTPAQKSHLLFFILLIIVQRSINSKCVSSNWRPNIRS